MKTSRSLLIALSVLLLLVSVNQVVYAHSETFPIPPSTQVDPFGLGIGAIERTVELKKNDRLVGSFTISNLQTWENFWGDTLSYSVYVTIYDPEGEMILSYSKTKGGSFDHTAIYSGVYTIRFLVPLPNYMPPSGIEIPQATLNYNIITPEQTGASTFTNLPIWMIPILAGAIISVIILVTYYAVSKRG